MAGTDRLSSPTFPHSRMSRRSRLSRKRAALVLAPLCGAALVAAGANGAYARAGDDGGRFFMPGNLVVSRSVYTGTPGLLQPGVTVLPPGCTSGCATATSDGTYPEVWNNDLADASFGITSPVFLDQITPSGHLINTLRVPDGSGGDGGRGDLLATSFSSKSELALNLSTSGRNLTFMGYQSGPNAIDVSNSNTPAVTDPTNPVPGTNFRLVAQVGVRTGRHLLTA